MADTTSGNYIVYSILPAMPIENPITCAGVVFCTTLHLDRYTITPAYEKNALLALASQCRTIYGQTLQCVGIVLVPELCAKALFSEGIPRICRDVVALCHITRGASINCHRRQKVCVHEADYFEAIPIIFNKDGFVIKRPGLTSFNFNDDQIFPTLPVYLSTPSSNDFLFDESLHDALNKAIKFFIQNRHRRELRQLFRAISIAMHATKIMPESESTYYDLGPQIISWVSAFETLVHPGRGRIGLNDVIKLVKKIRWHDKRPPGRDRKLRREASLNHNICKFEDNKRNTCQENSVCRLYRRLYKLRNDVAHGNKFLHNEFVANSAVRRGPLVHEIMSLVFRGCILERLREIGVVQRIPQNGKLTASQISASIKESTSSYHFDGALAKVLFNRNDD